MWQPPVTVMSTQHATHNVLLNDLGLLNKAQLPEHSTVNLNVGLLLGFRDLLTHVHSWQGGRGLRHSSQGTDIVQRR